MVVAEMPMVNHAYQVDFPYASAFAKLHQTLVFLLYTLFTHEPEVGLHRSLALTSARIRHFFQIRLRAKYRQSRMLLPDVKNVHK